MWLWLANVWDTVELWLTALPFAFQFALVIAILGPICWAASWVIDRAVDLLSSRFGPTAGPDTSTNDGSGKDST